MELRILPDYGQLSRATADLIRDYVIKNPRAFVCLASGHTPIGVFKCLLQDIKEGTLDLSGCTFFSLDEWVGVDPTDPGSCLSMLRRDFFDHLPMRPGQLQYFDVTRRDLDKECERINSMIDEHDGLDVMLVGVGTNGHIGMNEPRTPFNSRAHIGTLAEETKVTGQKYFRGETKLSMGITLGLSHLAQARLPIVMANGEKKAAIMGRALNGEVTEEIPVTIVQRLEQGYIMLDEAACGESPQRR